MSRKPDRKKNPRTIDELTADLTRRQFLAGVAAATGALALGGCGDDDGSGSDSDPEMQPLPKPENSGIEHIVVLMMENRSFDHFLGWVPGADGKQSGLTYIDKSGIAQPSFSLAPDFQNCRYEDPSHSYSGGRKQFNNGAADGWLQANTDDVFPIGYYGQNDLSFYGPAVPAWTTFDRYFSAILGPTYPNRFYMHLGQTDRLTNIVSRTKLKSIWDRLDGAGLTARYYYSDVPVTALIGGKSVQATKLISQFFTDAAAGTLANVTYIDPVFGGAGQGLSSDDHPLADIRNGQAFLNQIYEALTASPNWRDTVFIINYDEWGGFFDHVPPPLAPKTELDAEIGNDGRLGFRVPCVIMSPLARRGFVGHQQYDHTSILNMIEWRWQLEPLSVRDRTANNIARALDFSAAKNLTVPHFNVPSGPFGTMCASEFAEQRSDIAELRAMAERDGFVMP
jgi:phospholipase C